MYFKWKNVTETVVIEEEEVVTEPNNEQDSQLASAENSKLTIPIQINLKQYTGEVIGNGS